MMSELYNVVVTFQAIKRFEFGIRFRLLCFTKLGKLRDISQCCNVGIRSIHQHSLLRHVVVQGYHIVSFLFDLLLRTEQCKESNHPRH